MLISVITPVYNNEKYLSSCVESVLKQSFPDWEMILVDDGSTDQSSILCDAFAESNQRIKVIHQKNQGVSAARNAAIKEAKGDYLFFLDSDDQISSNMFREIVKAFKEKSPDILIINVKKIVGSQKYMDFDWVVDENESEETIQKLLMCEMIGEVARKCCKRALFKGLSFPTSIAFAEDSYITADLVSRAQSFGVVKRAWYYYEVRNEGSILHKRSRYLKNFNEFKVLGHYLDRAKKDRWDRVDPLITKRLCHHRIQYALETLLAADDEITGQERSLVKAFLDACYVPFSSRKECIRQAQLANCMAFGDVYKIIGKLSPVWVQRGIKDLIRLFALEAAAPFLGERKKELKSLLSAYCGIKPGAKLTLGQRLAVWCIQKDWLGPLKSKGRKLLEK